MSFIRSLRGAKFLSFLIVVLLTFSMAYPIIEGQWNPRAILNPSGTGGIRVCGQNTETHSFDLGDTLQYSLNTPSRHDLDSYQVEVQATGGYGITSYLDQDGGTKNQGEAKSYTVPSGSGLDNVYKATSTLSNGITRIEDPVDSITNNLSVETDDDAVDFDGDFNQMTDTNDKLEMTEYIIEQQTSDSTGNSVTTTDWSYNAQHIYIPDNCVVTKIEAKCDREGGGSSANMQLSLGNSRGDTTHGTSGTISVTDLDWYEWDLSDTSLTTGDYWINMIWVTGGDSTLRWRCVSPQNYRGTSYEAYLDGTQQTNYDYCFKVYVAYATGDYISTSIDGGESFSWGTMNINSNLDGATIKLYTDTDSDDVGWSYSWTLRATLGGGEESGINISAEDSRYLRYKIDVESAGTSSVWIDDVDVLYNGVSSDSITTGLNDPVGAGAKSIDITITHASDTTALTSGMITITGWTCDEVSGTVQSGYWYFSKDSGVETSSIDISFENSLNSISGWTINYDDHEIFGTCQQYGFQGDDTAGDFATADSVVETYNGDGVEIVATWTGANEIAPSSTVDWDFEETNYAGGDLSSCTYSYDSEFRQRFYRTCQEENMLINGEVPTYNADGGAEISVDNPTSNRPTVTFTGDNSTKYDFDVEIHELTVKEYDYEDNVRLEISDSDQKSGKIDYTLTNNGGKVRVRSTAIKVEIPFRINKVGVYIEDASVEDSGRELIPINEFRVIYGSTKIWIYRCGYESIIGDESFDAGDSIRIMITFQTETDDPYYKYTGEVERIKQGILVEDFVQVGSPVFREDESTYVVQAKLDVPTIWENYTFGMDKVDENYIKYCSKAEIVRYESNIHGDKLDYLETFEATYITEKNIYFGDLKFSPKYHDLLRLTLDMPELVVNKENVDFGTETSRAYETVIDVVLPERPFDVEQPYCEIDTGELSTLPQRFNYFIYQQTGENEFQQVEGRLNGYKLYFKAHEYTMEKSGTYRWVIVAQEKTLEQKFAVMWSSITRTEIPVGSVTLEYAGEPEYTYPEMEMPEWNLPAWRLPKITLPQYSVRYAAPKIDLTKMSTYASLILPVASLVSIMLAITISMYTIRSLQQREKKEQYMIAQ